MARRVRELYDGPGEGGQCPGPEACTTFLGAAQDSPDPEENRRNRDAACESVGKGCARLYEAGAWEREVVDRVEAIARERDSSRQPVDLTQITPLEWELLQAWDDCLAAYEREHRRHIAEVAAFVGAMARR